MLLFVRTGQPDYSIRKYYAIICQNWSASFDELVDETGLQIVCDESFFFRRHAGVP